MYVNQPPQHYRAGTTARIWITLVQNGRYYSPPSPVSVEIFYPIEVGADVLVNQLTAAAFQPPAGVFDQQGNYYFDFQIPLNAPQGDYYGFISFTDDGGNPCGSGRVPLVTVDP